VFAGAFVHIQSLETQDLSVLLESDSVTVIPIMAEFYNYFSNGKGQALQKARALRAHTLALLRSQRETPHVEFTGFRIYCLIQMINANSELSERRLLLDVVAQVGSSACFGHLDEMVRKVCAWELRNDERAKHALRIMVIECKNTIRGRSCELKNSQSLLRASEPSDGLLHPAAPPRVQASAENLLRGSLQQEDPDTKRPSPRRTP
jgi:hypothetical protein